MLTVAPDPLLDLHAFTTMLPRPLAELPSPDWLRAGLALGFEGPLSRDEQVRQAIRDLLRQHGYKPTGRGKPASEYLLRAATEGGLSSINAAVDACNVVSLHSGLPISVVDLDLVRAPLSVSVAPEGASYAFNASGQVIDVAGLPCLHDADGPCGNAVRDAQRSKTREATTRTLSLVWGTVAAPGRAAAATAWYRELLAHLGATTEPVPASAAPSRA